jgi:hypothetical protein
MKKLTQQANDDETAHADSLDSPAQRSTAQVIQQGIVAELATLPGQRGKVKVLKDRRTVARNGSSADNRLITPTAHTPCLNLTH